MYGQIVGSVTEINRKRNMASDVNDMLDARARALCRNANVDASLRAKVMEQVRFSIDNSADGFVEPFLTSLTGDLEVAICIKIDEFGINIDEFGIKHDRTLYLNDAINTNVQVEFAQQLGWVRL